MPNVNLTVMKRLEEEYAKKASFKKDYVYQQGLKDGESYEFRILDPLPNMNGRYFLDVVVWWINGKRIVSPETFGEPCPLQRIYDDAKNSNDKDLIRLLEAGDKSGKKIVRKIENHIPILLFQFNVDRNGDIIGITDKNGNYDVNLIDKYIVDGKPKILVVSTSVLMQINAIATKRGGLDMFTPDKGFNLNLSRQGKDRSTKYMVTRMDNMPVPEKYYQLDVVPDIMNLVKKGMRTDEYIASIMYNYLFGDPIMNDDESTFRYPELRKESEQIEQEEIKTNLRTQITKENKRIVENTNDEEDDLPFEEPKVETPRRGRKPLNQVVNTNPEPSVPTTSNDTVKRVRRITDIIDE